MGSKHIVTVIQFSKSRFSRKHNKKSGYMVDIFMYLTLFLKLFLLRCPIKGCKKVFYLQVHTFWKWANDFTKKKLINNFRYPLHWTSWSKTLIWLENYHSSSSFLPFLKEIEEKRDRILWIGLFSYFTISDLGDMYENTTIKVYLS